MSTLTKVLIILQTVFCIFLCGLIVTYVANANHYKEMYDDTNDNLRAARATMNTTVEDWKQFKQEKEAELTESLDQISALQGEIETLNSNIQQLEADKLALEQRVRGLATTVETANNSALKQTQLYETAQSQLNTLESEQIRLEKEYEQTNATLMEKMAVISTQDKQIRELQEEKAELQGRLERYLQQYGMAPAPAEGVTPTPGPSPARPIQPIGLDGRINDLDLENKLAEISVGAADGVKQEMTFIVTRGDQFVCNIVVLDVDAERAVGILELLQQTPRIGDKVSTNF